DAMAICSQRDPDLLIGARLNAPLVVGIGVKEWFVASDITAVIPYTKKVLLLGEGEMVSVSKLGPQVSTIGGVAVKPKVIEVKWDISQAQKGGFPHFMAKEINEAPEAVSNALRGRLSDEGEVTFEEFGLTDRQLLKVHDIKMVAAGTSYYAALLGKYIIEDLGRIPVEVEPASEFRYRQPIIDQDTLVIGVSQSGETADTPAAVQQVLDRAEAFQALARKYAGYRNFMYIGRGINYPIALEGALKLKEISYLHAEGYAAGELKHGPIALLDQNFPVFAIATKAATLEKMVSNIQEVIARDAPVLALISDGDETLAEIE